MTAKRLCSAAIAGTMVVTTFACGLDLRGTAADESGVSDPGARADASSTDRVERGGQVDEGDAGAYVDAAPDAMGVAVLDVTPSSHSGTVNLTDDGTTDWLFWGADPYERKNAPEHPIGNFSQPGPQVTAAQGSGSASSFRWDDGTPTTSRSAQDTLTGFAANAADIALSLDATPTKRRLTWYVGGRDSEGRFEASLSNGLASPVVDLTQKNLSGSYSARFIIEFSSSPPSTLTVHWKLVNRNANGFVTIKAATLK